MGRMLVDASSQTVFASLNSYPLPYLPCFIVACWPGKIATGRRTDALVQYADIAPTLLHLAGADEPHWDEVDG